MGIGAGINGERPGRDVRQITGDIKPVLAAVGGSEDVSLEDRARTLRLRGRSVEAVPHDIGSQGIVGINDQGAEVIVDGDPIDHDIAPVPGFAMIHRDEDVATGLGIDYVRGVVGCGHQIDGRARFPTVDVRLTERRPVVAAIGRFINAVGPHEQAMAIGRVHHHGDVGEKRGLKEIDAVFNEIEGIAAVVRT